MKNFILILVVVLTCFQLHAQQYSSSNNFIAIDLGIDSINEYQTFELRFEIQNDTLTLIDSFVTNQEEIISFLHTDFNDSIIYLNYEFLDYGLDTNFACDLGTFNLSGPSNYPALRKYIFKLMNKDSFTTKTFFYKNDYYYVNNLGGGNITYGLATAPYTDYIERDATQASPYTCVDSNNGTLPYYEIINDSLVINFPIYFEGSWNLPLLLFNSSTNDSLAFYFKERCGTLSLTAGRAVCHQIRIADTSTFDSLYVKIENQEYLFYKNNGQITEVLNIPVPIQHFDLSGVRMNHSENRIHWKDLYRENGLYYELMKSVGGNPYQVIYWEDVQREKIEYSFTDGETEAAFYKIRRYDLEKNYEESSVVKIKGSPSMWSISPNPVTASGCLYLNNPDKGIYDVEWFDILGKHIYRQKVQVENNPTRISLPELTKGTYFLKISGETEIFTERIVIH